MQEIPRDPRVRAMLAALLGNDWEQAEGDVAFEKTPIETWVFAVETMLAAADAADPIRVAIRGLVEQSNEAASPGPAMPSRTT